MNIIIHVKPIGHMDWEEQESLFNELKNVLTACDSYDKIRALSTARIYRVRLRQSHTITDKWGFMVHGTRSSYPDGLFCVGDNCERSQTLGQIDYESGFTLDSLSEHTYQQKGVEWLKEFMNDSLHNFNNKSSANFSYWNTEGGD